MEMILPPFREQTRSFKKCTRSKKKTKKQNEMENEVSHKEISVHQIVTHMTLKNNQHGRRISRKRPKTNNNNNKKNTLTENYLQNHPED